MDSVRVVRLYNLTFNIIMIKMLHVDGYNQKSCFMLFDTNLIWK